MTMTTDVQRNTVQALCAWLDDDTDPDDLTIESERPWASTYRVGGLGGPRFLKVLPPSQSDAIAAMPRLSRAFPEVVPETLAVDADRGLVLLADHGGTEMERHPSQRRRRDALATYANLQARATGLDELISRLPRLDVDQLREDLAAFVDPTARPGRFPAPASSFLDEERCAYYAELLKARSERLFELIDRASDLPSTINHCDLRPANTAVREDSGIVIFDWDEAVAGPAGLSLHAQFSGCFTPCEMLLDPASAMTKDRAEARSLLSAYLRTLAANGYAEPEELNAALPGAMCAGVMRYVLSYAKFAPPDDEYRRDVAAILRKRLNDLLKLGDLLHASSRETTLRFAAEYRRHDRDERAFQLLERYVERQPDDAAAAGQLAEVLSSVEDGDEAGARYRGLLERHPENGTIRRHYGLLLLGQLDFRAATDELGRAVQLGETDDVIARALDEAVEFDDVCRRAKRSGEIPTLRISADEHASGRLNRVRRKLAGQLFEEYGTLLFENAYPVETVERMHAEYLDRYRHYFVEDKHADALRVGNKRYMITVDIAGTFALPDVYANPFVHPVIGDRLGRTMIMGGFTSVCSLPDSEDMRVHKDHPALFPELRRPDEMGLPSFAVTAIVPMLGFNETVGTTRVWKGSHVRSSKKSKRMEYQDPIGPKGSCLLMDYRLTHQGLGNHSDQVRPILTMIYHRPWFRDIVNYGKQDPLLMSDETFAAVPEEHRRLFAWSRST